MKIHIISPFRLQGELILQHLESQNRIQCECSHFFSLSDMMSKEQGSESFWDNVMILWDAVHDDSEPLWSFIHTHLGTGKGGYRIVLFNVQQESNLEKEALDGGLLGVFYQNDDTEVLQKGLQALMDGQLWFSRKSLQHHFVDVRKNAKFYPPKHEEKYSLTRREKEILHLMSSGINNQHIAERLCISLHTIKTHITNIYRKIKVGNRFQAILWAHRNI